MATQIKVGDVVQVMSGGNRNRNPEKPPTRGKVLRIDREVGRLWVEGVNRHVHHLKKSPRYPQGGRLEREAPVSLSNVMLVTKDGAPVRIARAMRGDDGSITDREAGKRAAKTPAGGEKSAEKPAKKAAAKKKSKDE